MGIGSQTTVQLLTTICPSSMSNLCLVFVQYLSKFCMSNTDKYWKNFQDALRTMKKHLHKTKVGQILDMGKDFTKIGQAILSLVLII